jgi:hypothetical protein
MTAFNPAIITIGFNRPSSLKRLLNGLNVANYPPGAHLPLIIALDYEDSDGHTATKTVAEKFEWRHGDKSVIAQQKNLGLKGHILACGDLTKEYGAIIMFEDDIFPGRNFYNYSLRALEFCQNDPKVAGVSLYNHKYNVIAGLPFEPVDDGYDNYFLQFASSWGQAWTEGQWAGFREWHATNGVISDTALLPDKVKNWSDRSWLKHFDHYLVMNDLFFSYPRISQSTNFSDAGTHAEISYPHFQVSMEAFARDEPKYRFSDFSNSRAVYDTYFELSAEILQREVSTLNNVDFIVDLYGTKPVRKFPEATLFLTSRKLAHGSAPLAQFGMQLKPLENNIVYNLPGDVFALAPGKDLTAKGLFKTKSFALKLLEYFYGRLSQKVLAGSLFIHLKRKLLK